MSLKNFWDSGKVSVGPIVLPDVIFTKNCRKSNQLNQELLEFNVTFNRKYQIVSSTCSQMCLFCELVSGENDQMFIAVSHLVF